MSSPTVPLALFVVVAAGSLVLAGTFLRGPEYAAATDRARVLARGLAALGVVGLGLGILGLLALTTHWL